MDTAILKTSLDNVMMEVIYFIGVTNFLTLLFFCPILEKLKDSVRKNA